MTTEKWKPFSHPMPDSSSEQGRLKTSKGNGREGVSPLQGAADLASELQAGFSAERKPRLLTRWASHTPECAVLESDPAHPCPGADDVCSLGTPKSPVKKLLFSEISLGGRQ